MAPRRSPSPRPFAPDDRDPDGPWIHGFVICAACGHRWMAVRPLAATRLECPHCGAGAP
jgi:hypothetical protein